MSDIPEQWSRTTLGAILEDIQPGFASGRHSSNGDGLAHLRPMNVTREGRVDRTDLRSVDPALADRDSRRLKRGDVLFNNTNSLELVGKTALFDDDDQPAFSNHMTRLRVRQELAEPAFIASLLHAKWRAGEFQTLANNHVSQASVGRAVLEALPVLLPPLDDQRRIAGWIDRIQSRRASIADRLSAARAMVDRLRAAVLATACSGSITSTWREQNAQQETAAELASRIASVNSGSTRPRTTEVGAWAIPDEWTWTTPEQLRIPDRSLTYGVIKLGPPVEGGVPTLRSSDVRWLRIDHERVKQISRTVADQYTRTYLAGGEVVVTVRGSLGGVAVVPPEMVGWNVSREVAVVPLVSEVDPMFVACMIGSPQCQRWLAHVARGVAYTGINIADLKDLPLPLPPVDEQHEIVRRISEVLTRTNTLNAAITDAAAALDRAERSARAKAFRGELVL